MKRFGCVLLTLGILMIFTACGASPKQAEVKITYGLFRMGFPTEVWGDETVTFQKGEPVTLRFTHDSATDEFLITATNITVDSVTLRFGECEEFTVVRGETFSIYGPSTDVFTYWDFDIVE